jgi:translocation and assembly module TamA
LSIGFFILIGFLRPHPLLANQRLSYIISIEGISDRALLKLLEAVSETVSLRERPPVSLSLLQRRINQDIPILQKVLRSQGYYGARITSKVNSDVQPIQVVFNVDTGLPYILESVDIHVIGDDTEKSINFPNILDIGLTLKGPGKSKPILDAKHAIVRWYQKQGFPFPQVDDPKVVVDHKKRTVTVAFGVQPGLKAEFGDTEFSGLESVNEAYVRTKIPWKEGDPFNAELLRMLEERLMKTGLFSSANAKEGKVIDEKGRVPVGVEVRERKHRTIKGGLSYKTDEGPGGNLSWEHRNILGRGQRLKLSGLASGIALATEGRFRRPEFLRSDQALLLNMRIAEDSPDAFKSRNFTSIVQIERKITKHMDLNAGLGFRLSKIEQFGREERFDLLSLPVYFHWDTSDQLLDPTRGGRMTLQVAPFYDFYGEDLFFYKGYAQYSRYINISKGPFLVLALRAALGAMSGAERDEIPADIRFYPGGGGSIRGYAYQSVGPTQNNEPIGGRSLITMSAELRIKITEKIGLVAFIDGGSAFESAFPDFGETLQWGGGLGFRYFTAIGPLRLDVGIPINRRARIDDSFRIYVSIGQAF